MKKYLLLSLAIYLIMGSFAYAWWWPYSTPTPKPIATPKPTPIPTPKPTPTPSPVPIQTSVGSRVIVRSDWGAIPPLRVSPTLYATKIVIHHTAFLRDTTKSLEEKVLFLQKFHQTERGFDDIAYHFFIDMYGNIAEGRPLYSQLVHPIYNASEMVHIVLEGDFTREAPTLAQIDSLFRVLELVRHIYPIEQREIYGHKDFMTTLCPGTLYEYLPMLRETE